MVSRVFTKEPVLTLWLLWVHFGFIFDSKSFLQTYICNICVTVTVKGRQLVQVFVILCFNMKDNQHGIKVEALIQEVNNSVALTVPNDRSSEISLVWRSVRCLGCPSSMGIQMLFPVCRCSGRLLLLTPQAAPCLRFSLVVFSALNKRNQQLFLVFC